MDLPTQNLLLEKFFDEVSWKQPFIVQHDGLSVDLSSSVGKAPKTPFNAPDQPKFFYVTSKYRFPKEFNSLDKFESFRTFLNYSLPGADFIKVKGVMKYEGYTRITLKCDNWLNYDEENHTRSFPDGSYIQDGVRVETIKRTKTSGMISTFDQLAKKRN